MKSKELKALNVAIQLSHTIDELKENTPCNVALNMDIIKKMIDNNNKENECLNCECSCKNAFGICNQI